MPKAISQIKVRGNKMLTIGRVKLAGSIRQAVHDGDTITTFALGSFGIRMLGIDTPEVSFTPPGSDRFVGIARPEWDDFLSNPFAASYAPFQPALPAELEAYLRDRTGPGCAANHARFAEGAHRALELLVEDDLQTLAQSDAEFSLFLFFAQDVMDRYGRLLAFARPNQPDAESEERLQSYNARQLAAGHALPYFIWPNVDPFLTNRGAIKPADLRKAIADARDLQQARMDVRTARAKERGVFANGDALRLSPFELRFLAGRRAPDRWVIDLSRDDDRLLAPTSYWKIEYPEDRLFVPTEYAPLFKELGWKAEMAG